MYDGATGLSDKLLTCMSCFKLFQSCMGIKGKILLVRAVSPALYYFYRVNN